MQEKAKARLRELASAARGSQEAGFTQPSLHLFLYVCEVVSPEVKLDAAAAAASCASAAHLWRFPISRRPNASFLL